VKIDFVCTYWGSENLSADAFFEKVIEGEYDGIEINFPNDDNFVNRFLKRLQEVQAKRDFIFIAQQVLPGRIESFDDYLKKITQKLFDLVQLKPDFINSHTGKDYYSFVDNCRIIEVVENISLKTGVPIFHETHRGRFSYHAPSMLPYLEKFPDMKLVADFSHWCTVSESLLNDQKSVLDTIIPHVAHLHARVGYEHSPQVNNPFAPEWKNHFSCFLDWWNQIINHNLTIGKKRFTICPEFGPVPYMPTFPFTNKPLSDQWNINIEIKNLLKQNFSM
jgi:hypothetical protein